MCGGVHKILPSVAKNVNVGNAVYFSKGWSGITNMTTGRQTTIHQENGVYVMELEVLEPEATDWAHSGGPTRERSWMEEISALRAEVATLRAAAASQQQMSGERRLAPAVRP